MNVMLDIETLGLRPTAPIVALGACRFDGSGITSEFYTTVALESAVEAGAVIEPDTLIWWLGQSESARAELSKEGTSIQSALTAFNQWLQPEEKVWGNGAGFDNTLVREAANRANIQIWHGFNDRCYRTVKNMFPAVSYPESSGIRHHALDDAKFQAMHLVKINRECGLGLFDT